MDEPRSVTLTSTLTVCSMIAAGLFAARTAFGAPGWVWLAGVLFLALAVAAALTQSSAGGRYFLSGTLRTRHYTQVYRYVARRLNDWVWRRVGRMRVLPNGTKAPPPEIIPLPALLRAALTWRLLDRALLIALAYPLLALLLPWLLGREAVMGAAVVVLPTAEIWPDRAMVLAIFVILIAGVVCQKIALASSRRFFRKAARWLPLVAVGGAFLFATVTEGKLGFAAACAAAILIALSIARTVFVRMYFAIAGASAVVAASTFSIAFAGALVVTLALVGAFSLSFASGALVVATFAFATVVAFLPQETIIMMAAFSFFLAAAFTVDREWHRNRYRWALALLAAFWATGILSIVLIADIDMMSLEGKAILVFLAVLPFINGLLDTLSYALTLALSRKGLSTRWAPLYGLADLALGAVLFVVLGASMVAVLAGLNAISTAPLYDLAAMFEGLRVSPGDYWWLYLILFSTLAPTALHLVVAALAVQGWVAFQRPRRRVADWVTAAPASHGSAVRAFLAQATIWWLPLMALVGLGWGLWQVIGTAAGTVGLFYLDQLEGLAHRMGAI